MSSLSTKYTRRFLSQSVSDHRKEPNWKSLVDINNGDCENPEYKSRLVAKEINYDVHDEYFADTPLWRPRRHSSCWLHRHWPEVADR